MTGMERRSPRRTGRRRCSCGERERDAHAAHPLLHRNSEKSILYRDSLLFECKKGTSEQNASGDSGRMDGKLEDREVAEFFLLFVGVRLVVVKAGGGGGAKDG